MMENKTKKKKKLILSLIGIMVLVLFSVGLTYAFYSYTRIGTRNNVINTLSISINFEDNNWIWLENAFPMTTEEALTLETNGNGINNTVKGGIAQFKVFGNNKSGTIRYEVLLEKDFSESTMYSKDNTYSLNPDNYIALFPDETISINLQTSTSNIFETTGLVNDKANLYYSRNSFLPSVNAGYLNESGSITIRDLANDGIYLEGSSTPTKILGYGSISGDYSIRYFELRMWVNENATVATDTLRNACLSSTSQQDVNKYGYGYCNPNTPNLPEGVKYVYTAGEYSKLFFSNKIRVETVEVMPNTEPDIIKKMKEDNQVKNETANMYNNVVTTTSQSGLFLQESTRDNVYPIYFYRGIVNNNHLLFADKCWRIVRTTETGGVKILYDGVANNGVCNNTYANTEYTKTVFGNDFDAPQYVGYMYNDNDYHAEGKGISAIQSIGTIVYGKDVVYRDGKYKLVDTVAKNGANYSTDYSDTSSQSFRYHHYTCFNSNNVCSKVYYIHYADVSEGFSYFALENGKTHKDILEEMLYGEDNAESNVLTQLSEFFMNNFENVLEYIDTQAVFCNDRSIYDYGGWDIDGDNTHSLYFGAYERLSLNKTPSLECQDPRDRFSMNKLNGNGKLIIPIGVLTADEMMMAGAGNNSASSIYIYNNQNQWTMTPVYFYKRYAIIYKFSSSISPDGVDQTLSLRPVLVLNNWVEYDGGDGTSNNPYKVKFPDYY